MNIGNQPSDDQNRDASSEKQGVHPEQDVSNNQEVLADITPGSATSVARVKKDMTPEELCQRLRKALPHGSAHFQAKELIHETFAEQRLAAVQELGTLSDPKQRASAIAKIYSIDRAADLVTEPFELRVRIPELRYSSNWYRNTIDTLIESLEEERRAGRTETIVHLMAYSDLFQPEVRKFLDGFTEERSLISQGGGIDAVSAISFMEKLERMLEDIPTTKVEDYRVRDIFVEQKLVSEWFGDLREQALGLLERSESTAEDKALSASLIHCVDKASHHLDRARYPRFTRAVDSSQSVQKELSKDAGRSLQGFLQVPLLVIGEDKKLLTALESIRKAKTEGVPYELNSLVQCLQEYCDTTPDKEDGIIPMSSVLKAYMKPLRTSIGSSLKYETSSDQHAIKIAALQEIDALADQFGIIFSSGRSAGEHLVHAVHQNQSGVLGNVLRIPGALRYAARAISSEIETVNGFQRPTLEVRRQFFEHVVKELESLEAALSSEREFQRLLRDVAKGIQSLRYDSEYKKTPQDNQGIEEAATTLVSNYVRSYVSAFEAGYSPQLEELSSICGILEEFYTGYVSGNIYAAQIIPDDKAELTKLVNHLATSYDDKRCEIMQDSAGPALSNQHSLNRIVEDLRSITQKLGLPIAEPKIIENRWLDRLSRFAGFLRNSVQIAWQGS